MLRLRSAILCALLFVPAAMIAAAQQPALFQFQQKPGPFSVGLRVVEQYDPSRTYLSRTDDLGKVRQQERARPLQTLIWYPAEKTSAPPMTVKNYFDLLQTETSFGKPDPDAAKGFWAGMAPTFAQSLWAVRDARPVSGRFPLVIYDPSFSAPSWENADLCEYLASHGYVVIASPSIGATGRGMTVDLAGIDAQARDISFLIGYAQSLPDVDMSEIAVGGFSWGGVSNLFAAARDNRIDALFALDGSMRYFPGLVKRGDVHPDQMALPLLFFAEGEITPEMQERMLATDDSKGPNVLNEWTHGDLITVETLGFTHQEHASMYQRDEEVWKEFPDREIADYGREYGAPGYARIARYMLAFLDAYLKHDAASLAFLKRKPAENGVPPHEMSVTFRAAQGPPPTLEGFRAELGRQGFDHAAEIYAALHKEDASFKLDEAGVNAWGYRLIAGQHVTEAIDLFKLNVQLYPESWNAYDSLGEAYMDAGEKQLAIDNYKKSLSLNPDNKSGGEKLKQLEAQQAAEK